MQCDFKVKKMVYIKRFNSLKQLHLFRDKKIIKVVTGVRRCGKSVLLEMFAKELLDGGVKSNSIISINFEDFDNRTLRSPETLYDYVKTRLQPNSMNYIFLDEIQHVEDYADVVDALFVKENVDLYITGSNAYMLSSEIATLLSGRYVEIKLLPFSLREYAEARGEGLSLEKLYADYVTFSSFPYAVQLGTDTRTADEYLRGIYSTIVLKDVMQRNRISDSMMLESVMAFLADNIGNTLSTKKIADTMLSSGRKIDVKTVEKYIAALRESCIVHQVRRFDAKGKYLLRTMEKYYLVDVALRNVLLGHKTVDYGHVLENVIYLELLRRYPDVYIGKVDDMEIDFVAVNMQEKHYYQVCATMRDEATRQRELKPLESVGDNFPKTVLTLDPDPVTFYNGIKQQYALDWLLDDGDANR